jgi:CRP-like cAMP-binding protein
MKKSSNRNINDDKELIKFLSKVTLFGKFTANERKNLRQYIYVRQFNAGEQIFKKGYPNVVFYILKEGELKVYLEREEGEIEVNRLKPLDFFGEIGLFLEENRTASAVAVKDSVLLAISKRDLANFIGRFPRAGTKILYKLGEILSTYIIELNKKITKEE